MQRSEQRILTTHAGSLPRPDDLIELHRQEAPADAIATRLPSAVDAIVAQQIDAGVDVVDDGEFGKATRASVDYGAWWYYIYERMQGFEVKPGGTYGQTFGPTNSQDRITFTDFYDTGAPMAGGSTGGTPDRDRRQPSPVHGLHRTGYLHRPRAHPARHRQPEGTPYNRIRAPRAFMPAVSPATLQIFPTTTTRPRRTTPGPSPRRSAKSTKPSSTPASSSRSTTRPSSTSTIGGSRPRTTSPVSASGPSSRSRPSTTPSRASPRIACASTSAGAAGTAPTARTSPSRTSPTSSSRSRRRLTPSKRATSATSTSGRSGETPSSCPDGKILIPGVVSHATNVLEHPELVADRIVQYANLVGRENVIAGTDCGLGGRIHPQLVWAKLRTLAEGAALASKQLWA